MAEPWDEGFEMDNPLDMTSDIQRMRDKAQKMEERANRMARLDNFIKRCQRMEAEQDFRFEVNPNQSNSVDMRASNAFTDKEQYLRLQKVNELLMAWAAHEMAEAFEQYRASEEDGASRE